jgi:hypothetical protein
VNLKHKLHNIGVAQQIARYSDAIEITSHLRWLHPSGTPGLIRPEVLVEVEVVAAGE